MVEAAVYDLEFHLTTFVPGVTGCLRCLYPQQSATWTRKFPVLGAVSGTAGGMAALEAIKVITGVAPPLAGRLITLDLRTYQLSRLKIGRIPGCVDCAPSAGGKAS